MRRSPVLFGVIIVTGAIGTSALPAAGLTPAPSVTDASALPAAAPDPCLRFDQTGDQVWEGEASAELDHLANRVQLLVDEHTETATGVAMCSGFDGVAVFVTATDGELAEKINAIAGDSSYPVLAYTVPASLDTLLSAGQEVMNSELSGTLIGFAPDMYSGALVVEVGAGSDPSAVTKQARQVLAGTEYAAVEVAAGIGGEGEALVTRKADLAPYWMGGELVSAGGYCSSGVRITIAGVHRFLTAGHCTSTTFTNDGNLVGNQYTTAYRETPTFTATGSCFPARHMECASSTVASSTPQVSPFQERCGAGDRTAPGYAPQAVPPGRSVATTSPTRMGLGPSTSS